MATNQLCPIPFPKTSLAHMGLRKSPCEGRGGAVMSASPGVPPPCTPLAGGTVLPATLLQLSQALKNNNQCGKTTARSAEISGGSTERGHKGAGILTKLAVQLSSFLLYADNHLIILLMTVQPARK